MKNIINTFLLIFTSFSIHSQTMTWIHSHYLSDSSCEDLSDCEANIHCYKLQYTPQCDGVLSSYTSGFFIDCIDGGTKLLSNQSCVMKDNSKQTNACETYRRLLINCSANTGNLELRKEEPYILHQVCFDLEYKMEIRIQKDPITGITTSVDGPEGKYMSEMPSYVEFVASNVIDICDQHIPLNLHAQLNAKGSVDIEWIPSHESGIGAYSLMRRDKINQFDEEIYTVKDQKFNLVDNKYAFVDELDNFGEFTYYVVYNSAKTTPIQSNEVGVRYLDLEFNFSMNPNPAHKQFVLFVTGDEGLAKVSISNESGQLVRNVKAPSHTHFEVDVSQLTPGVYYVTIEHNQSKQSKKLVVIN